MARSAWQPLTTSSWSSLWLQPMIGAAGVPGGSWWQRYRGGTHSFVSLQQLQLGPIQEQEETWGQRLALPPGTGSLTSSAPSPWVEANWQGTGRAHTALFWEQVWLLALPTWALGTLHTWHLQMRSQRGRSHRCHSSEVGFPKPLLCSWPAPAALSAMAENTPERILVEGRWASSELSQSNEAHCRHLSPGTK